MRVIVADIETTGLFLKDGHKIIEFCGLEMIDDKLTGKKFHSYFNPMRDIPDEAFNIHGISNEFVKYKPLFKDKVDELLEFIRKDNLVFHNAEFDIKFINNELTLLGLENITMDRVIDTLELARIHYPNNGLKLDNLCIMLDVKDRERIIHGAEKDALLLSDVYLKLMEKTVELMKTEM